MPKQMSEEELAQQQVRDLAVAAQNKEPAPMVMDQSGEWREVTPTEARAAGVPIGPAGGVPLEVWSRMWQSPGVGELGAPPPVREFSRQIEKT
jgi:hypothetical protein